MPERQSAIVTGYSSGLGKAITTRLLEQGWHVTGVSRQTEPDELHARFGGDSLAAVHGSVDAQDTADEAFEKATMQHPLKLVVSCAGEGVFGSVGDYTAADISAVMASLNGLILFSELAVRHMREHGGDIVNVMSTAGKKLRTGEAIYVASKWGGKAYTRTLRDALKADKAPIRVFEVYPCGMNTRFWSTATRPVTDGASFPSPEPIADCVLDEVLTHRSAYCQEFTFERG